MAAFRTGSKIAYTSAVPMANGGTASRAAPSTKKDDGIKHDLSRIFFAKKSPQTRINAGLLWYNKYMENEVKNSANASEDLVALRSENEKLKA